MRTPRPVPPPAASGVFRSRESAHLGISEERLRRRDVRHPHHGAWTLDPAPATLADRCREWLPLLLPGQAFSHRTALALRGAPIDATGPLHVSVLFPRTPPRGSGMHGHSLRRLETEEWQGLPVSVPASAWLDHGASASPTELVVVADHLLTSGQADVERLGDELRSRPRAPGAAKAAWALARARRGARSRPETHLRLALVRAGLPEPVIEPPIPVAGGVVLHPDLGFLAERVLLEYEGDGHRTDREQWMRDIRRRELLEAAGWRVVRVTAHDLYRDRAGFLSRLRGILAGRRP